MIEFITDNPNREDHLPELAYAIFKIQRDSKEGDWLLQPFETAEAMFDAYEQAEETTERIDNLGSFCVGAYGPQHPFLPVRDDCRQTVAFMTKDYDGWHIEANRVFARNAKVYSPDRPVRATLSVSDKAWSEHKKTLVKEGWEKDLMFIHYYPLEHND